MPGIKTIAGGGIVWHVYACLNAAPCMLLQGAAYIKKLIRDRPEVKKIFLAELRILKDANKNITKPRLQPLN